MGSAFHGKGPVSLVVCLLMTSALSAQAVGPDQPPYYYKASPRVGGNPLRGRERPRDTMPATPTARPEGLKEMPPLPPHLPPIDVQPFPPVQQPRIERPDLGWVRYLLYAVVALLGGWGAPWGRPDRSSLAGVRPGTGPRPRAAPPPRQEQLGLGADGRGGVWLREVPAWEDEQAPGSD
jgi:hypothetical protein